MPNWVFNHLTIEGSEEDIAKVKAQLNKPFTKQFSEEKDPTVYSNPVFAFWNIVAPPEDKLNEYFGVHGYADGGSQGDTEYNWYNFNNREWGTKWDVGVVDGEGYSETSLEDDDPTHLRYRFDTAWSAPNPAIEKLSEQYPELEITLSFEEEQGWGGEYLFTAGSVSVIKEWDIPDSHADYVALDREDSCSCAHEEDKDEWYDDCPGAKGKAIILKEVKEMEIAK